MNKKKKRFISYLAVLIIIFLLYFYVSPIYIKGLSIFKPRHLNLSGARNYYTVLASVITLLGLFLGYLYYVHKLKVDKESAEHERKRKRLDYLIKEINNYNDLVDEIIHFRFSDVTDLERLREKISRSYEIITTMLMHKTKLLGFNDEDAQIILRVHSFVEKNDILMQYNYQDLNKENLLSVKSKYIDLIQDARQTCFEKIC